MYHRIGTALNAHRCRLLIDRAAQGFHSRGFTERQVERVDMATAHVQQTPHIVVTGHHLADAALVQQLQLRMAVALPQALLRLQVAHVLAVEGGEHATVLQIALDLILGHALTDDPAAFKGHLPQQLRLVRPDAALDHVDIAAVAVDDLPTVATRSTKTHLGGFQHRDAKAVLQQKQRTGKPGIAGPDHAHIGLDFTLQHRTGRNCIRGSGVIRLGVGGVRHPGTSVLYFLRVRRSYLS